MRCSLMMLNLHLTMRCSKQVLKSHWGREQSGNFILDDCGLTLSLISCGELITGNGYRMLRQDIHTLITLGTCSFFCFGLPYFCIYVFSNTLIYFSCFRPQSNIPTTTCTWRKEEILQRHQKKLQIMKSKPKIQFCSCIYLWQK